jgi:hypothetical protein
MDGHDLKISPIIMSAQARLRVVSLLPSATEILALIGGESLLVGRSHECDYPASVKSAPILTSSSLNFESSRQIDTEVVRVPDCLFYTMFVTVFVK